MDVEMHEYMVLSICVVCVNMREAHVHGLR